MYGGGGGGGGGGVLQYMSSAVHPVQGVWPTPRRQANCCYGTWYIVLAQEVRGEDHWVQGRCRKRDTTILQRYKYMNECTGIGFPVESTNRYMYIVVCVS